MKIFITGGAGFIGNNLVERLVKTGHAITVYDNFSSGKKNLLPSSSSSLQIIRGDVLDFDRLLNSIKGNDFVYHLSANPDVRRGSQKSDLDLQQETIATYNVLECMRRANIKKIVFPSSMTVYGRVQNKLVGEYFGPCLPISLYGAAKLSCEAMISAFCETFNFQAWVFRLANVIGKRTTHGVIYDLINKLIKNPKRLEVLGDGNQSKPYILVDDVLDGMQFAVDHSKAKVNLFNLGASDAVSVKEIVRIIIENMGLKGTKIQYEKTPYGWIGDVPKFNLDVSKIENLGFKIKHSYSIDAVKIAVSQRLKEIQYNGKS